MSPRAAVRDLDREFVTIYFLQGEAGTQAVAFRRIWLVLGVIAFLFCTVFLRVWVEMHVVKTGYQCGQIRHEVNRLSEEGRVLRSQRDALASLDRVETIAREKWGLQTPQSNQVIFLHEPGPARGAWTGWYGWAQNALQWFHRLWGQPVKNTSQVF